jgi:glutathione peroxidase
LLLPIAPKNIRMRFIKKILGTILILLVLLVVYALFSNRKTDMTARQKILKTIYPALMWINQLTAKENTASNPKTPPVDFFGLSATNINGTPFPFSNLRGKKVLLVNTASDCGYTGQYDELQQLQNRFANQLLVIGFPANDFKEQEKGSNEAIASFCRKNFGVSFPLMEKSVVVKKQGQHPVYEWLTQPAKNGWNDKAPNWNFSKYLIDEDGRLTHFFETGISPLSTTVINAIQQ